MSSYTKNKIIHYIPIIRKCYITINHKECHIRINVVKKHIKGLYILQNMK